MTNKEKFKEIFGIEPDCGHCTPYPCKENDCKYWEKCENEPGCPCDNWWEWEFEEPTTKNDLGVDVISIKAVDDALYDYWYNIHFVDDNGFGVYQDSMEVIHNLPSVTPQAKDVPDNNAGEILDKIRAEIKELHDSWHKDGYYDEADALAYAMKVIDRHEAESEE